MWTTHIPAPSNHIDNLSSSDLLFSPLFSIKSTNREHSKHNINRQASKNVRCDTKKNTEIVQLFIVELLLEARANLEHIAYKPRM